MVPLLTAIRHRGRQKKAPIKKWYLLVVPASGYKENILKDYVYGLFEGLIFAPSLLRYRYIYIYRSRKVALRGIPWLSRVLDRPGPTIIRLIHRSPPIKRQAIRSGSAAFRTLYPSSEHDHYKLQGLGYSYNALNRDPPIIISTLDLIGSATRDPNHRQFRT